MPPPLILVVGGAGLIDGIIGAVDMASETG